MAKRQRTGPSAGDLGIAGASFAAFMVVASLSNPGPDAHKASHYFAVCIPLAVAALFIAEITDDSSSTLSQALNVLHGITFGVAQIGCAIGIYHLFKHVGPEVGSLFLSTALGLYLSCALLYLIVIAIRYHSRRSSGLGGE